MLTMLEPLSGKCASKNRMHRWGDTFDAHKVQFEALLGQFGLADPMNLTARKVAEVFAEHWRIARGGIATR